jgi:hypothetical protein
MRSLKVAPIAAPRHDAPEHAAIHSPQWGHRRGENYSVWANLIRGGLHHDYRLVAA